MSDGARDAAIERLAIYMDLCNVEGRAEDALGKADRRDHHERAKQFLDEVGVVFPDPALVEAVWVARDARAAAIDTTAGLLGFHDHDYDTARLALADAVLEQIGGGR